MAKRLFDGLEYLVAEATGDDVFTPEDLSEEQRQVATTAEQFARTEARPAEPALERHEAGVAAALMRKAGEAGLLMIDAPAEYGGLELDKATSIVAAERMSAAGSFSVSYAAHSGIGTLPLVYYGTPAQKARYLERIVTGEWSAAYCLTEPGAGSDALGGSATARLSADGTHWVLDGVKQFITNGSFADLFTVFAKVDGKQFTAFLVERTFPGLSTGPEERKLGIKGSSTTQVILEGVPVPRENVLGEIGKGHKIAFNVLNVGRFKLGAAVVGASKLALASGAAYALQRRQFGVPIATFGAIREKLAHMTADLFAAESLLYRLAGQIDERLATIPRDAPAYYEAYQAGIEAYAAECAIAKVFCSEVNAEVVDEVVQIHGGYGFVEEYPAEKFYRDERINRIYEGTNEINRMLVPVTALRRAARGDLPLERAAREALAALTGAAGAAPEGPLGPERASLTGMKRAFLALAGAGAHRFGDKLKEEQEALLALADVAIQAYAAESAVLRAERIAPRLSPARRAVLEAAASVATFRAAERAGSAARRAAHYLVEGAGLAPLLAGLGRAVPCQATGLLAATRRLAEATLEAERYPL
jgi:butyryl-CoA dehydrogenase